MPVQIRAPSFRLFRSCGSSISMHTSLTRHRLHGKQFSRHFAIVKKPLSWYPEDLPNVSQQGIGVCDPESLLSPEERASVEKMLTDCMRPRSLVVIISSMHSGFNKNFREYNSETVFIASQFVLRLHDLWGLGRVLEQERVVLFISAEDRK